MKHKKNMNMGIPWSCGSAPSQETEQIRHLLIHAGLLCIARGSCRRLPCLGLGPISGPHDLNPKLLWSRARKRSETLPLLTKSEAVETLMYLYLPPGGWPPTGEPSVVDNAPCLVTQRDRPDEVAVVRLHPKVHPPVPI